MIEDIHAMGTSGVPIRLPVMIRRRVLAMAVGITAFLLADIGLTAQPRPTPRPIEPANPEVTEALGPSDEQLELEVTTRLHQVFPGTSLGARVNDGVATLDGTVRSERDRRRAARIIRRVEGVSRVINELDVDATAVDDPPLGNTGATLETAVVAELRRDPVLGSRDIRVFADRGSNTVTLIGTVASEAERERATRVTVGAFAAVHVRNQLRVEETGP